MPDGPGKLFLVATPIGNLEDISGRALRILGEVDVIAAEDTRRTGQLLARYKIRKPLLSYHEFNEARRTPELLEKLRQGATIALVSDAGMPTVSDPGRRLVRETARAGLPLEVVPGPSALTAALAGAGLVTDTFFFQGFLPHKTAGRRRILAQLAPLPCALVFFESPFRLHKCLVDLYEVLGNRPAVVGRELTKKFEEFLRGDLESLAGRLADRRVKGEITIVVEGVSSR
ncbi:16S rRNA (cytidine(1402)-2'-O)-methyltransferase [bacterium]|nr:16S rRNA (cytidine(1402)-2'-O)-methyltransferase [bacterium]